MGGASPDITTRRLFRMKRGKKYAEAAKSIDRMTQYDKEEAISLVKKVAIANLMRQSKLISGPAATAAMQNSRSAAQLCCPMVLVRQ